MLKDGDAVAESAHVCVISLLIRHVVVGPWMAFLACCELCEFECECGKGRI